MGWDGDRNVVTDWEFGVGGEGILPSLCSCSRDTF